MSNLFGSEGWEEARATVTSLGGLIALVFAARTYVLNSRSKREEHPRLVYSRCSSISTLAPGEQYRFPDVDPFYAVVSANFRLANACVNEPAVNVVVEVFNRSDQVIGPAWVRLCYSETDWPASPGMTIPVLAPGSSVIVHLLGQNEAPIGNYVLVPGVTFRDSAGHWWERKGTNPIRLLRVAPRLAAIHENQFSSPGFRSIELGNGLAEDFLPAWKRWLFDACLSKVPGIGPQLCNGKWRNHAEKQARARLERKYR